MMSIYFYGNPLDIFGCILWIHLHVILGSDKNVLMKKVIIFVLINYITHIKHSSVSIFSVFSIVFKIFFRTLSCINIFESIFSIFFFKKFRLWSFWNAKRLSLILHFCQLYSFKFAVQYQDLLHLGTTSADVDSSGSTRYAPFRDGQSKAGPLSRLCIVLFWKFIMQRVKHHERRTIKYSGYQDWRLFGTASAGACNSGSTRCDPSRGGPSVTGPQWQTCIALFWSFWL